MVSCIHVRPKPCQLQVDVVLVTSRHRGDQIVFFGSDPVMVGRAFWISLHNGVYVMTKYWVNIDP